MLQEKQMISEKQIVLETVEEYADPSNRSTYINREGEITGVGQYHNANGKKCAVGRCMNKKALEKYGDSCKEIQSIAYVETGNPINIDVLLKKEYKGCGFSFWSKLQELHDKDIFWSEDGITENGVRFIRENFDIEI